MTQNKKIRYWMYFFIFGMLLSGITAFPLEWEMSIANEYVGEGTYFGELFPWLGYWTDRIYTGLSSTYELYPFLAYGTDWLAFAHIVLAILFIGPLRDPVKNIWIIEFGMICCVLVVPFAMIFGAIRDIPLAWRMIDSSFGVIGIIPLFIVHQEIKKMQSVNANN